MAAEKLEGQEFRLISLDDKKLMNECSFEKGCIEDNILLDVMEREIAQDFLQDVQQWAVMEREFKTIKAERDIART
jgi:RNA polymerase Rpb1, domain 6